MAEASFNPSSLHTRFALLPGVLVSKPSYHFKLSAQNLSNEADENSQIKSS